MDEPTRSHWERLRAMLCDERYALGMKVVEDTTLTPQEREALASEFRRKTQEIDRITKQLVSCGTPQSGKGSDQPAHRA